MQATQVMASVAPGHHCPWSCLFLVPLVLPFLGAPSKVPHFGIDFKIFQWNCTLPNENYIGLALSKMKFQELVNNNKNVQYIKPNLSCIFGLE